MSSEKLQQLQQIRKELWRRGDGTLTLPEWRGAISPLGFSSDEEVVVTILEDETLWIWQETLGLYIPAIFPSERFPSLAVIIEEKTPTFLWKEMYEAAVGNPDRAKEHIVALSYVEGEAAARTSASLIVGVARTAPAWANERITSLLGGTGNALLTALRAIQLCVSERTIYHERLISAILGLGVPHDGVALRYYLHCLLPVHEIAPITVEDRILEAMRIGPDHIREQVMTNASLLSNFSCENRKRIVDMALAQKEQRFLDNVGMLLIKIYAVDRAYPLSVIRSMAEEKFLISWVGQMDRHLLSEIGKIDRTTAFEAVNSWFDDSPSDILLFQISDILLGIFDKMPKELIDLTHGWGEDDVPRFRARTEILRELLCERAEHNDDIIVVRCAEDIIQIADLTPSEYERAVEGERDLGYWALRVLNAITSPWGEINYERVFQNLDRHPHIKRFLDQQWLEQMRQKAANDIRIFHMLDCEDDSFLTYWDDVFHHLDPRKPGLGKLRRDLRKYWRIQDTLSEAEVISRLGRRFDVDVKISLDGLNKEPDLRPHLTDQAPILEVYTPEEDRKLLYGGGGGLDKDVIKNKILDKFRGQYKPGVSIIVDPVVFVVHAEGLTLLDDDMMNILFGTLGMTVLFDRSSGRVVEQRADRAANSIHVLEPDAGLISGFLVYRRDSRRPADEALHVEYFPNPGAWRPLTETSVAELCSGLSDDWIAYRLPP